MTSERDSKVNEVEASTYFNINVTDVPESLMDEISVKEIILSESLLTPGLQTFVRFNSFRNTPIVKNFDLFKNKNIIINIERPILALGDSLGRKYNSKMTVNQRIYRLDNRKLINNQNEEMFLRACDPTQLTDLAVLVSKSWKSTSPSSIVSYVLRNCARAQYLDIEGSNYPRDYTADNIHPFQVVNQQASYAVNGTDDPSFLHYMTFGLNGEGIHHFRSLKYLSGKSPIISYRYDETSNSYKNVNGIMTYSFPCDFDLMSDILNGIDAEGRDINSAMLFNPWMKSFSLLGSQATGCGLGAGVIKTAITNMNSSKGQNMTPDYSNVILLKRQARMSLLNKDKIALKLTVPFNIDLHAGKVIEIKLYNKSDPKNPLENYGTGKYLIVSMFHQILMGGLATTTMECVSQTAGQRGIV